MNKNEIEYFEEIEEKEELFSDKFWTVTKYITLVGSIYLLVRITMGII